MELVRAVIVRCGLVVVGANGIGPRRIIVRREDGGVRTRRCKLLMLTV